MKIKLLFIITLLLLLSFEVSSQRGGGSRSSSSRSSSRSYSSSKRTYKNSSISNGQTQSSWHFLAVAAFCGVPLILICQKIADKKSKRQTRRITDAYELKNQQNLCTLDQDQRNKTIDWFMNSNWTVQFRSAINNNGSFTMKITDIVKRTDFVYQIQAVGENDVLGDSDMKGILLFQSSYLSICFDKVYKDRERAGQTGKWRVLIYEGVQKEEMFEGGWYFEGFERHAEYSGEMRMIHN